MLDGEQYVLKASPEIVKLISDAKKMADWAEDQRINGDNGGWEWSAEGNVYPELIAAIDAVEKLW